METEIHHFSHVHPLVPMKDLKGDDEGKKVVCYGCLQPALSGSATYYCTICEEFFHKSCVELPLFITHPSHPQHPLKLLEKGPGIVCFCEICKIDWTGFVYNCSQCGFNLDILCAQTFEEYTSHHGSTSEQYIRYQGTITHPGHPHPLRHKERSALFKCDACGVEDKDESYDCSVCSFWIHKTCGSLPSSLSQRFHTHPLSVAYCLPEKYRYFKLNCDICRKKLNPFYWVYFCGPCRYFFHLKCMISKSQGDEVAEDNSETEITPDLIRLPAENVSSLLIRHYLERNSLPQIQPSAEINHFSHEHPLILETIQDDYSEMTEEDEETVCNACAEPISGPCYSCVDCKYVIHFDCAQLPKDISSSVHPEHKLSLGHWSREFFRLDENCEICGRGFNGFFYECKECDFLLDIKCALLPGTIKHEAHRHPLVRRESAEVCNACMRYHGQVSFGCERCGFSLAIQCAMLPKIVRHRWDDHPLILSTPPFYYHPDEFICDMCECEIHPRFWIYHCRECDNSFHPRCVPRLGFMPYVKLGGTVQIGYHQHPLTFRRLPRYRSHCDYCGENLIGSFTVFECESCLLALCRPCVVYFVDSSRMLALYI